VSKKTANKVPDSPACPAAEGRKNLLAGTAEGILAMPWVFLSLPSNFILASLLTQKYQLSPTTYGIIASLPAWANAVQIFVIPWLSKFLTAKDLALGMGWLNVGLWTMFAAILPYLPVGHSGLAHLLIVFFLLSSLSQSFTTVGWTSWVKDWVPARLRGRYFGVRNRWLHLSTVIFLLVGLVLFELEENALWPYQALIITGIVMRYGSLIWQYAIRTSAEHHVKSKIKWRASLSNNLSSPGLVRFILFSAWVSFWLGFAGPFLPVYSFEKLGLLPSSFSILVIIATITGIFGWWFWGKQVDHHGCVPILFLGLLLWELPSYIWVFVTPSTTWMLYPLWAAGGFFSTAYLAASFNLLLKLVPRGSELAGVSLHLSITSLVAATAPIIAGVLLFAFMGSENELAAYRAGFAIKSSAVLLGLLFLVGLKEPQRKSSHSLPGAFRTLRQLLGTQGPSLLSGLISSNKPEKKDRKNKQLL